MEINKTTPALYTNANKKTTGIKTPVEKKTVTEEKGIKDKVHIGEDKTEWGIGGSIKKGFKKVCDGIGNWVEENITGDRTTAEGKKSLFKVVGDYGDDHKRMAVAGACTGGAIGTGVGLWTGRQEVKSDQVDLTWRTRDIKDPKLTGYSHWTQEVGHYERDYAGTDSEGNAQYTERYVVDGYWHNFSPDIHYDKVGTYQTPEYAHTNKWTPITAGFTGLVGGSIIGGIVGFTVSVANKLVRNRLGLKKPKPEANQPN